MEALEQSPAPAPGTVVMKFGGSSVADPEKVKLVARRFVEAKRRGLHVVGTVSAMGKTTDQLIALATEVSPVPDPRELDMLPPPASASPAPWSRWRSTTSARRPSH
jgi:aspartokinase